MTTRRIGGAGAGRVNTDTRFGQVETVRWLLQGGAVPDVLALWESGMTEEAARAMAYPEIRERLGLPPADEPRPAPTD